MSDSKLSPVAASGANEPDVDDQSAVPDDQNTVTDSRSSSPTSEVATADEDPTYARKDLIDLLDTHFYDDSCSSLSQCLRSLPNEYIDVQELRDLIFRVNNIPRSKSVSSDDWRRCVALFSLEVLKRLHTAVMHTLLEELNALTEHVEYWQGQQGSPMLHYLKKGPKHWWRNSPTGIFSSGLKPWLGYVAYLQRNEVEEILHNLDLIQKGFLTQVGQIYNTLQMLNRTEDLKTEIEGFVGSAEALFLFLSGKEARRVKGPFKFLVVLSDICSAIPEFKLRVKFSMIPLKKPSHLRRYWITYTIGVTAGSVVAYRAYQHRELIATYLRRSFESLRFFITDHIIDPITKIYHHVFVTLRQRNANATAHSLRQNREALSNMLLEFGKENADYNASKEGVPVASYLQTLPTRSAEGDMSIVLPRYEQEVQKPVRAAVTGHLVRGLLIQVQKVKTDTEAAIITLDQVMEANELNFQLLALIPALLGLVFVGYTTKRLLYRRSARDQKLRSRISKQLHRVEMLLIQSYAKDKLDDTELGQLLLQVYLLEQWSRKCMPQEKLIAFLEDLERLKAHDLTPEQKMLIVQRLYRSNRRLLQD